MSALLNKRSLDNDVWITLGHSGFRFVVVLILKTKRWRKLKISSGSGSDLDLALCHVFNSTNTTPESLSTSEIQPQLPAGSEQAWPRQRVVLETIVGVLETCRDRGMEGQENRSRAHASVLPWWMNTAGSWRVLKAWWGWIPGLGVFLSLHAHKCMCWDVCGWVHTHMYTDIYTHSSFPWLATSASREINSKMTTDYMQILSSESY